MTKLPKLVLASASPRRREILENAGLRFIVRPANVVEEALAGESPVDYVLRLAREKAGAVSAAGEEVILAADTVVVVDGHILEKPADAEDARRMLRLLAGREHEVITGTCLKHPAGAIADYARTRVHFLSLADEEIAAYVATGEPLDKAGAYAIQGRASRFIDRIEGCYFNVVGLPIALVYGHLRRLPESR